MEIVEKLDVLVCAAHPDDAELGCGGTICKLTKQGKRVGIVDFTAGELGTRGTPETRQKEAAHSSQILGIQIRENLQIPDGFFSQNEDSLLRAIQVIRKYQPDILLVNAPEDRHPDHGNAASFALRAAFLSGLPKIKTQSTAWRPKNIVHYIQDRFLKPTFVVDISQEFTQKMDAIKAFRSQFYDPNSAEPLTYISNPDFLHFIDARAREMGHLIGTTYGEGFIQTVPFELSTPLNILNSLN